VSNLTDWETGQIFIYISDTITEQISEVDAAKFGCLLRDLDRVRARLGDELDALKSHNFGIYNGVQFRKEHKEKL